MHHIHLDLSVAALACCGSRGSILSKRHRAAQGNHPSPRQNPGKNSLEQWPIHGCISPLPEALFNRLFDAAQFEKTLKVAASRSNR
jgi:hypothetical protein